MRKNLLNSCTYLLTAVIASGVVVPVSNVSADTFIDYNPVYSEESENTYEDTEGIGGFVARLYRVALGRDYDTDGFIGWCDRLYYKTSNGASVSKGFLLSYEFKNKEYSNEEFVAILYNVFFDREPDPYSTGWVERLEDGETREDIINGFVDSPEWINLCEKFGIVPGSSGVYEEDTGDKRPTSDGVKTFVTSLYSDCLGREPDDYGLEGWTESLINKEVTGKEAAYGFFFSPEFQFMISDKTEEEIITIYYKVFLNREPDYAGMDFWLSKIAWGLDLDVLFMGFADSEEFSNKCEEYGIEAGESLNLVEFEVDEDFYRFANYSSNVRGLENFSNAQRVDRDYFYIYNYQNSAAPQITHNITISEQKILQEFASEHFNPSWTDGQKILYTLYWINRNVTYGSANGDYCASIFVNRVGQCAQYNGALVSMITYLGYDAAIIRGYRGYSGNKWSHYWGELYIDGEPYVMETGNYGDSGDWSYFCQPYSNTTKFVKGDTPCS